MFKQSCLKQKAVCLFSCVTGQQETGRIKQVGDCSMRPGFYCPSLFFFLATLRDLQDIGSPTRDWIQAIAMKALSPNHWTTEEFPSCNFNHIYMDKYHSHSPYPCYNLQERKNEDCKDLPFEVHKVHIISTYFHWLEFNLVSSILPTREDKCCSC